MAREPWPTWAGGELALTTFDADPRAAAVALLGKLLVSVEGHVITGGRIVETEAYLGADDPGSHASTRGVTARNATMYGPYGHVYVYFTYGSHHMLNIVCEPQGTAGAVLIRALEPVLGQDVMVSRRSGRTGSDLTNGPGKLARALGIDLSDNGVRLNAGRIFVYDATDLSERDIQAGGRVGLSSGHDLEYRYFVRGNPYVSRGRTGPLRKSNRQR